MRKEKIVGILGGMGPYATVDFYQKILDATPAKKDWEHIRILLDSNVKIPSRTRAILYQETSPAPDMIKSINNLASIGADFVAVPCNSAHYFYPDVSPQIKIPWLNMIDVTSQELMKLGERPLILGGYVTVKKKLYSEQLPNAVYPSESLDFLCNVIEEIKLTSSLTQATKKQLEHLITNYRKEIDSIIIACTELSIIYPDSSLYDIPLIDSNMAYAKAVVSYAKNMSDIFEELLNGV